jgi:uncharacterized protein YjbJ (UPF0337 family)
MNKDQLKGKKDKAKGNVKESAGKLVGNRSLEGEGKLDKAGGSVREAYGDVKESVRKNTETSRRDVK